MPYASRRAATRCSHRRSPQADQPLHLPATQCRDHRPDGTDQREREAVAVVTQGLSNDQIAGRMVSSPPTAKTHVDRAMTKLHARDRAQFVVLAYESGLVAPRNP